MRSIVFALIGCAAAESKWTGDDIIECSMLLTEGEVGVQMRQVHGKVCAHFCNDYSMHAFCDEFNTLADCVLQHLPEGICEIGVQPAERSEADWNEDDLQMCLDNIYYTMSDINPNNTACKRACQIYYDYRDTLPCGHTQSLGKCISDDYPFCLWNVAESTSELDTTTPFARYTDEEVEQCKAGIVQLDPKQILICTEWCHTYQLYKWSCDMAGRTQSLGECVEALYPYCWYQGKYTTQDIYDCQEYIVNEAGFAADSPCIDGCLYIYRYGPVKGNTLCEQMPMLYTCVLQEYDACH